MDDTKVTTEQAISWFEKRLEQRPTPGERVMFSMALSALRTQQEKKPDGWISVKDRLPEKQVDVLMLFEHNMTVGFWHDGDEHVTFWCSYTDDGFYTDCDEEPTHWMPLPEPPKEE